jgi:hypothetical protein
MEYIIISLLQYIEIWDESLQIEFSNSIYKIFYFESISEIYNHEFYFNNSNQHLAFISIKENEQKEILRIYYGMRDIVNPLLKFLMKVIFNDDRNVRIFNKILVLFHKKEFYFNT